MATLFTDYAQPYELSLTARVGQEEQEASNELAAYLPVRNVSGISVEIEQFDGGMNEIAEYRAYDAENSFGETSGGEVTTVKLPPLGQQARVSEWDQLNMRNITNTDLHVTEQLKVAKRLGAAIASRIELARGQVISTGQFQANENGFVAKVDFGRAAEMNATADNLWSDPATATPISDISAWTDAYVAQNGFKPTRIRLSAQAIAAAKRSDEVKQYLPANSIQLVTLDLLNQILASDNLPAIWEYDKKVKKAGKLIDVMPADTAVLMPDPTVGAMGATAMGTTLESLEASYGVPAGEQPGIVVGAYKSHNPIAVYLNGAAIGLPILGNANAFMSAKVL